ncbi:MAG: hypothetical protein LIO58_05980 [Oscillospiraceae bacterium]|nr:hypothetical protein [Oscillospiraceae bacterium]
MKKRLLPYLLSAALVLAIALPLVPAYAADTYSPRFPTGAMDVTSTTDGSARYLTTLTQQDASLIPLVFGVNVIGGDMDPMFQELAGTEVNIYPDPYVWNYNYEENTGRLLPDGTAYSDFGNIGVDANGLFASGGANQTYVEPQEDYGGTGYAVGCRSDVIIGFQSLLYDQIDLVNSWRAGYEFYQAGDEDYRPLILDVQTGSVTSRLYAWAEMGQALSAYLDADENEDMGVRYGDPHAIAVDLEAFSAGIPYYIASLIASGDIDKKTMAYIASIDGATLTAVDPGMLGNVTSDLFAEVNNFNFLEGHCTLSDLMAADVDVIVLGVFGNSYVGGGEENSKVDADKLRIINDLYDLGYSAEEFPLIMDADTISVMVGEYGYGNSPITPLLMPYIQAYAYMDELDSINSAINPVAMVQFATEMFFHTTEDAAADVAGYYIDAHWDSVAPYYDQVPELENYTYDKNAIIAAIQEGVQYALSGAAEKNGNLLLGAYRTTDNAYSILTEYTQNYKTSQANYIKLTVEGQTRYLDLDALSTASINDASGSAIISYYEDGVFNYGADLQTTLQNYADHMQEHVWQPDTTVPGTCCYGMTADTNNSSDSQLSEGTQVLLSAGWTQEEIDDLLSDDVIRGYADTTFAGESEKQYFKVSDDGTIYSLSETDCLQQVFAIKQQEAASNLISAASIAVGDTDQSEVTTSDGYMVYYVQAYRKSNDEFIISARFEWIITPFYKNVDVFGLGHDDKLTQIDDSAYYAFKYTVYETMGGKSYPVDYYSTNTPTKIQVDEGGTVISQDLSANWSVWGTHTGLVRKNFTGYIQYQVRAAYTNTATINTAALIYAEYYHQKKAVSVSPSIGYPANVSISANMESYFDQMSPNPALTLVF